MKIRIFLDKPEYYPGEKLTGIIKVEPFRKSTVKDIEMHLNLTEEWNHLGLNNKNEIGYKTQRLSVFYIKMNIFLNLPKNAPIVLDPKEYTFPFEEKLPDSLLPSFEFPKKEFRAFLRYSLLAKAKIEDKTITSSIYIKINSIPKKDDKNFNLKTSLPIRKWGMFNRGQTTLKALYLTKNYKLTDTIPVEIEIDNTNSKMKITECKLKFNRKVIFKDKETFTDKYTDEETLVKKMFKITVNKKDKKSFNFSLDLKPIKYKDFPYVGYDNPYKDTKYGELMPSLDGNIIHCEYSLLIRLKYSHHMPKEERPAFTMTVYIVHKLDDDHIEKKKRSR